MTFIPTNLDDVEESKPVAIGKYDLQITGCEIALTGPNSKRPGSPQFKVTIGFVGDVNAPNIQHYISLPHEEDEPSASNYKALLLKRFLVLFNVSYDSSGIDTEKLSMEMVGASANAEVGLSTPNDNGDIYNRLIVPKIRGENEARGSGKPPMRKRA